VKTNIKITFLILVIIQGIHSIEEYFGHLWDVFQPAKVLTGFVSDNLEVGFLIINICLFLFGMWSWIIPVRNNNSIAKGIIWFWILIEMINGIGHPIWALLEKSYVLGVATAPILLVLAVYLFRELKKT